jgi:uncharacterized protein (DUF779 family)
MDHDAASSCTPAAEALIASCGAKHGPLMFFQSGGCCDGSAPMCYPQGEFQVSDTTSLLGNLDGAPFYMGGSSSRTGSTRS